jgi:polyisoprenoid-binding protein YceI
MSKWNIDPDHSVGSFAIRHLMVAHVHGQFNKVSGTISFDPSNIASLTVELEIDVSSIITGIDKRDEHLKSEDFFHTDKYPKITFKSTKVEMTGYNSCKVNGELTIHGVTRPTALDVYVLGPVKSPFGETSLGISGRSRLNREVFGIAWNQPMEDGGVMVGKDADIYIDIEADLVT